MNEFGDVLIRGSEKIIGHYRLLLATANTHEERKIYGSRIERAQRFLDELRNACRIDSRHDFRGE